MPVSSFSFSGSSLLLGLLTCLWTAIRSPRSGCHAGLNKPSSLSLPFPEVIRTSCAEAVQLLCCCSQVGAHLGWIHTSPCASLAAITLLGVGIEDRHVCPAVTLNKTGTSQVFSRDSLKPCLLLGNISRKIGKNWISWSLSTQQV